MVQQKNKFRFRFIIYIALIASVFVSIKDSYSQGRDRSKYQPISDTGNIGFDTSKHQDTSLVKVPLDSTARIKYFKYVRTDKLFPSLTKNNIPFFLNKTDEIVYKVEFDSSDHVIIKTQVNNEDVKYPLVLSFDRYVKARSRIAIREQFYSIMSESYKIETQDELSKIFKNITDITIPLPFKTETIFGPPTINLKINGQIDITASYQKTSTDQQTISTLNQSQNNINFKQEVQVTAKGSIGDKLTIDADWNSQRTFDYENQLRLKYSGYPDEVVQSIEAGNVSLETKSNLIGSTQALFGIKGQFKLGPLTLTAIASQKKSEIKEVDVTGGSQETNFEIPAYQYADNHFFLDENIYPTLYQDYFATGQIKITDLQYQVAPDIEVWVQTTANNPNKRFAVCWTDSLPATQPGVRYTGRWADKDTGQIDGQKYSAYFVKLNPGDFTLNDKAGYVSINVAMPQAPNDAVAVAYRYLYPQNNQTVQYGTYANDVSKDSLVLVLVHYPGLQSPTDNPKHLHAWLKKIKSIYSLGVRNIKNDPSKFQFNVYYKPPSGENELNFGTSTYLRLLKLDLRVNGGNFSDTTKTDGNFDFYPGLTVDLNAGEVIFPTLDPFFSTLKRAGVDSMHIGIDSVIYSNSKTFAATQPIKYYMGGKAIGDASSHYSLGFNIVQGSVKVYNGSVQLVEGVDYTVDYSTGELDIRNASALNAGSNLKITYESNDLFTLASKTLLGTRMEYNINKTSYVGFTLLNLQQQTLNDKVRIGEEPTNNTMVGFDAATQLKMNFLTSLIDKIPGYNTKEESTLDLRGELAYMLPVPNTKKSLIPSDNGEAVAYLDDFEGAKKVISLGLNPLSWTVSSIPLDSNVNYGSVYSDSMVNYARCKFEWYNLLNNVNVNDVYPNRQVGSSQSKTLTPLVFRMLPSTPGMYTYIDSSHFLSYNPDPRRRWAGVFKYLNTTSTNLIDENIGFIEIWMKLYNIAPSDSARMMIDLGLVSEKIIPYSLVPPPPNFTYHTEDVHSTGVLDPAFDLGIDVLNDEQERAVSTAMGFNVSGDAARDNFSWQNGSTDFSQFNGTEGNSALSEGRRPDSEDLNGNGILDVVNNYFEYVIPIDSTGNNKYITGGGNDGWYQFRIPLNEYTKAYGNASLTNVQYVRVWFNGFKNDADSIKIVDFNLVGNQWQKTNKNDTSYSVSVVNIEDNSGYYNSPVPGNVLRQTDQTSVDQNVLLNEQSMSLDLRNLVQGQGKFATKNYNTQPIDLLNYKIVKLFVNGDPSFNYTDTNNYDAAMVVRFGSDTANFYEYRAPIHKDIRPNPNQPWNSQNEVQIVLTDLTQIKQLRDSVNTLTFYNVPNGPPGAKYGVVGNPTLSSITQISLGVENNHRSIVVHPISGSVWFDELRVLKTDDRSGYAYNLSAALKVADFGTFNFTYSSVSPTFHSLENRFGSRDQTNNWELSGSINLHTVFNSLLASLFSVKLKDFLSIPLTFSHTEAYDMPQFVPGTDIDLLTAMQTQYNNVYTKTGNATLASIASNNLKIASQNLSVINRIAVNGFKFTLPGENYFIQEMLNKLQISYYWNSNRLRSPTDQSNVSWDMGGTIGMTTNIKLMEKLNVDLGKWLPLGDDYKNAKLYFFFPFIPLAPLYSNDITIGASFSRSRGNEQFRNQLLPNPTTRAFTANRNFSLDWKFIENWLVDLTGSYTFGAGSDLTYLETTTDSLKQQRSNGQIYKDIFFSHKFINFGKDLSYNQVINMNPKVNIPVLKKFLDVSGSYRVQYGWSPTLTNVPGNTAGYTADFQSTGFLKLNQLFDLFKSDNTSKNTGGGKGFYQNDQGQSLGDLLKIIKGFIPDQVTLTYSQTKTLTNGGILGNSGFNNFWVNWKTRDDYGPSRLYQLGWGNYPGPRADSIQLTDREGYANSVNISTFITPIFPNNLKISFTYKTSWSNTNQLSYNTGSHGFLGLPVAVYNIRDVSKPIFFPTTNIVPKLAKPNSDPVTNSKEISDSFDKNIASFPFPSWDITLNGIEKFDLFSKFASAISFENSYSTDYKKTFLYTGQPEIVQSQSIISTFSPLIGINVTFKEFQGGTLTASFKLNKTNNLDLTPSSSTINNTVTSDFSINASYTKSGFKIPLFGLSLDNDLSIVFTYTKTTNDPRTYNYDQGSGTWSNNALNGSISTTLNPSIQYALSKNVSITVFYKYTIIGPSDGSIQIPTQKSNEAGLNLRLSIQ